MNYLKFRTCRHAKSVAQEEDQKKLCRKHKNLKVRFLLFAVLTLILLLFHAYSSVGQSHSDERDNIIGKSSDKFDLVNIYEFGKPLVSCETNFENLFNNFKNLKNLFVDRNEPVYNSEDISLRNFFLIETIADTGTIDLYAKSLTDDNCNACYCITGLTVKNAAVEYNQYIHITSFDRIHNKLYRAINIPQNEADKLVQLYIEEKEKLRNEIKSVVSVGDKVYSVFFNSKQQIDSCFVICSHKTNKVIVDNVFLNILILNNSSVISK
jgi:hypothetical protein